MSVDGFIEMPSFRPDGRLERLNHGGGSKLPKTIPGEPAKVQKQPDFIRLVMLAAHQKGTGNKKLDPTVGYTVPYGQGKLSQKEKPKGTAMGHSKGLQSSVSKPAGAGAGASDAAGVYTQPEAGAAGTSAVAPKKRRTLLSGGGRSFGQPYGSDTILGG